MFVLKVSNGLFGMETIFKTLNKEEMDEMKAIAEEIFGSNKVKVVEKPEQTTSV